MPDTTEYTTKPCPGCGQTATFTLDTRALRDWKAGQLVQRAFPHLSTDEREALITGYCVPCWDRHFGKDD